MKRGPKVRDIEEMLREHGFSVARRRGSHVVWKHANGTTTILPSHHRNTDVSGNVWSSTRRALEQSRGPQ